MMDGALSARALCEQYLERIERWDRNGPCLNAVIERNSEALELAGKLDQERANKGPRGPLHGIPILLKDNIDTGDGMMTTAGSLALENHYARQDAFLVARLRRAGALILGKTNLSEWANFRSNRSVSGWSSRGGQTRNPYDPARNPCGSSSGSAVAVAAEFCSAAIGTETDGSIVCPASVNGIVGFKPSLGLVSRSGVIPVAHSQDTAGPMTRSVRDAAILMNAIAGHDPNDPASEPAGAIDYTQYLSSDSLHDRRVGVLRQFFGVHPKVDEVMENALRTIAAQGAVLVDPVALETREEIHEHELEVLLYEFKTDLNEYLAKAKTPSGIRSLADLIAYNQSNAERVMPFFGQELLLQAQAKGPLSKPAYVQALETSKRLAGELGIDAAMRKHNLDGLVAPSNAPAWLIDPVHGDRRSGGSSTPAAVAGYPNVTVPAGFVHGLPVGISFMAGRFQDAEILGFAYAFEQAAQARRSPKLN